MSAPLKIRRRSYEISKGRRLYREIVSRAFSSFAFCATFFGLAMLLVFFITTGKSVVNWFADMPKLIDKENQELLAKFTDDRMKQEAAKIDTDLQKEFAADLKAAKTEEERAEIRADMKKVRDRALAELKENEKDWRIEAQELVRREPSPPEMVKHFLFKPPGDKPSQAGIMPALWGSFFVGLITIAVALPLGVGTAVFLEEYQQDSRLARIIQVNINNLAGVPSIMYGILGFTIFVEYIFKPLHSHYDWIADRNLLGGGLTLALLTLPLIIVSSQEAIRAVPKSLRHGSLALGATRWQTIWRVVLPASTPGILTGTILGLCRALGEAAPLVMFGALLFVTDKPGPLDRFGVLPMLIFDWSNRPGPGWLDHAAMASAVLLAIVMLLNGFAIWYRNWAQKKMRW
jgi:phosphate transport system permease protein